VTSGTLTAAPTLFGSVGESRTLDDVLVALWQGITSDRTMTCPVCDGKLQPMQGVHARAIGGECATCGSTFS